MKRIVMLAALCCACSSTPAERVQYGLGAIKLACEAEEKHPEIAAELPPDAKAELDAICPVVATARQ